MILNETQIINLKSLMKLPRQHDSMRAEYILTKSGFKLSIKLKRGILKIFLKNHHFRNMTIPYKSNFCDGTYFMDEERPMKTVGTKRVPSSSEKISIMSN